jgi:ABC-type multidrug transport system permease subunit
MQTLVLSQRSCVNGRRDVLVYWIRAAMYVAMAILMGTCWWDVGTHQDQIQDRFSCHFFAVAFLCFMAVASIPAVIEDKANFDKERANGAYDVLPYVLNHVFVSLPFILFITLLFSVIAYPMIALQPGPDHFLKFVLFLFLSLYLMEALVGLISAILPVFVASLAICAFLNGFFMCVQGYFIRYSELPGFWIWGHYWSYQTYAFEALIHQDFVGLTYDCQDLGNNTCFCNTAAELSEDPCTFTGLDVLRGYGYDDVNEIHWMLVLIGQIVLYRFLFYLVLKNKWQLL